MQPIKLTALLAVPALLATPALTFAGDEGDIGLRIVNNKIVTTIVADEDNNGNEFDGPVELVFEADFGEFEDGDAAIFSPPPGSFSGTESFITNLPGFDTAPGTFDGGVNVGLDIVTAAGDLLFGDNLVRYNPATNMTEQTTAELQINFGSLLRRTDGSFGSDPLFLPAFNGGGGEQDVGRWHRHLPFAIYDGLDAGTGDLQAPSDGVYILQTELVTEQTGIMNSDPIFIVFGVNTPETQTDAGIDFVEAAIPEPASLGLLAAAGLGLIRRR
jgi:hypothetical protein